MINSSLFTKVVLALSIVSFVACDTDYNSIGSDIIDDDVHYGMTRLVAPVTAYDRGTGVVQSNNLTLNTLGAYDSPVFGKTVAHFVTQVELATLNPTLYAPEIDSVYLYVPYFSAVDETDAETGISTYTLDSIYGTEGAKIDLAVYRNGFFLRDSDPGSSFISGQKYYSDDLGLVDAAKVGGKLNTFSAAQSSEFAISKAEIERSAVPEGQTAAKVVERKAPGIFLYLNKDEFQSMLFGTGATGKLVNNNVFKEYFRGLFFKVTQTGQSVMVVPRFDQGTITIKYRDHIACTTCPGGVHSEDKEAKTMTLNLKGNTINFFENTPDPEYSAAIADYDNVSGDEQLYLKGGVGSIALIDINEASLAGLEPDPVTGDRVLINEANLVFYVDKAAMAGAIEPIRLILYDMNNKRPITDYYLDTSTTLRNPKFDKFIHGGILQYDTDGRGLKYKIRITDHINNLVNKDSTNVKLGLAVTEYINLTGNAAIKSPLTGETFTNNGVTAPLEIKTLPVTSVMHPFGTILYGSNPAVPEDKRIKLEIFYTKPN